MRYSDPYSDQPLSAYSPRPSAWKPWLLFIITAAGAGYGAHWGWKERARLQAEIGAAKNDVVHTSRQLKTTEEKVAALQKERDELVAARDVLTKDVAAKSTELAALKGTFDKLQDKMKDEIARGDIQLFNDGGKLRVGLVDKILFDSGEAKISKRGEGVLARVGAVLAPIDDRAIQVSGHTDNQPISDKLQAQYPTNWELSSARATNVVRFLAEQAKVPAERLVSSGYGPFKPIASNRTARGKARNRRIEILLTPSLAPKRIRKDALAEHDPEPGATGDIPDRGRAAK